MKKQEKAFLKELEDYFGYYDYENLLLVSDELRNIIKSLRQEVVFLKKALKDIT